MHRPVRTALSRHVAMAVLVALTCGSCTSRPLQGVLISTSEAVEGTSQVPILIGTTRVKSSADPGEMFSREASSEMAFARR